MIIGYNFKLLFIFEIPSTLNRNNSIIYLTKEFTMQKCSFDFDGIGVVAIKKQFTFYMTLIECLCTDRASLYLLLVPLFSKKHI